MRSLGVMCLPCPLGSENRTTFEDDGGRNRPRCENAYYVSASADMAELPGERRMRLHAMFAVVLLAAVACSSPDRAGRLSPTAPSAATIDNTPMGLGGISGPMDVHFPSRAESFEFRNQLETKYQSGLGRSATSTYVDREGDVVWVQEYIRYRVNGCDHETASARVMTQIDGGAPGGICAENREFVVLFPPRDQSLDFRRRLETKYQQMGRGLQPSFVDIEGSVI